MERSSLASFVPKHSLSAAEGRICPLLEVLGEASGSPHLQIHTFNYKLIRRNDQEIVVLVNVILLYPSSLYVALYICWCTAPAVLSCRERHTDRERRTIHRVFESVSVIVEDRKLSYQTAPTTRDLHWSSPYNLRCIYNEKCKQTDSESVEIAIGRWRTQPDRPICCIYRMYLLSGSVPHQLSHTRRCPSRRPIKDAELKFRSQQTIPTRILDIEKGKKRLTLCTPIMFRLNTRTTIRMRRCIQNLAPTNSHIQLQTWKSNSWRTPPRHQRGQGLHRD